MTICAKNRRYLFWDEFDWRVGADIIRPHTIPLSLYGRIIKNVIEQIPVRYPGASVEKYIIMPNHIHLLLRISVSNGRIISAPTYGVPTIIGQMKRAASKQAQTGLWQKGYHDHIIRSEADYLRIWDYIDTNPAKWREDCYYCQAEGGDLAVTHSYFISTPATGGRPGAPPLQRARDLPPHPSRPPVVPPSPQGEGLRATARVASTAETGP